MKRLIVFLLLSCLASRGAEADPPLAIAPFDSDQAKALQKAWADHLGTPVEITNPFDMKLNLIPPGEFTMGGPASEPGHEDDETQHLVKITKPFYLSAHEVTQAQYERLMGKNPSFFRESRDGDANAVVRAFRKGSGIDTSQFPVEMVNLNDAVAFCRKLSNEEGVEYRLPTEAEWEYACRAGTTTAYSFGDDASGLGEYAWYKDNSNARTHPVGELKPNAWGLYDMHGNVWEWCQNWWGAYDRLQVVFDLFRTGPASGDRRVLRGGAIYCLPKNVRAAVRLNRTANRSPFGGFRLARTIP